MRPEEIFVMVGQDFNGLGRHLQLAPLAIVHNAAMLIGLAWHRYVKAEALLYVFNARIIYPLQEEPDDAAINGMEVNVERLEAIGFPLNDLPFYFNKEPAAKVWREGEGYDVAICVHVNKNIAKAQINRAKCRLIFNS